MTDPLVDLCRWIVSQERAPVMAYALTVAEARGLGIQVGAIEEVQGIQASPLEIIPGTRRRMYVPR